MIINCLFVLMNVCCFVSWEHQRIDQWIEIDDWWTKKMKSWTNVLNCERWITKLNRNNMFVMVDENNQKIQSTMSIHKISKMVWRGTWWWFKMYFRSYEYQSMFENFKTLKIILKFLHVLKIIFNVLKFSNIDWYSYDLKYILNHHHVPRQTIFEILWIDIVDWIFWLFSSTITNILLRFNFVIQRSQFKTFVHDFIFFVHQSSISIHWSIRWCSQDTKQHTFISTNRQLIIISSFRKDKPLTNHRLA
jgi:hypothetical protein